ncbi:DnaJ-domain-containing protein [Calocera cornea HHB12733]|uniref:DnaJ-domain-containing protein n=1 Tax=Calocera cornea HHB12733 TaxID=1353952 RepID=A0A165DJC4_9BASI|nr:DnaJ-domain-containing protein [Calocera cornea HHB12733]
MENAKESLNRDYYTILGIPKTANFEELRTAFRRKALLVHPDRLRTKDAARQFIELHDAYRYLADPIRRARYDRLFYDIDCAAAIKAHHATDEALSRRKSESGLRPNMAAERERTTSTEQVPYPPPEQQAAHDPPTSPKYPNVDPYPSSIPQLPRIDDSHPTVSTTASSSDLTKAPRDIPIPPSPMERTSSVPLPEPCQRGNSMDRQMHGRSTSAAPPKGSWTSGIHSEQTGNLSDISIPPPQHLPPRHSHSRSRSRSRPSNEMYHASSDTDVSIPVYYKPLKAFQPLAPIRKPVAWVYPLGLTLAELYAGCKKRFGIQRALLNGETEENVITIDVEPGWTKGTRVTYPGAGNEVEPGVFQDLVFVVRELPDQRFEREGIAGQNLIGRFGLRLADALTADRKRRAKVRTVDGRDVEVRLPDGIIKHGDRAVLPGEGMPIRQGSKIIGKGDLIIEWVILFPDNLTTEQIAALRLAFSDCRV